MTFGEEAQTLKDEVFLLYGEKGIAVKVEGKADVDFWTKVFHSTLDESYKIEIYSYSNTPTPNTTGKQNVLEFAPFTDRNLVLCIDSDYDYLHQTESICSNPYIFQTYCYSIENVMCEPKNLDKTLQKATNVENINVDFNNILKKYSETIYELLVLSVALCAENDKTNPAYFSSKKLGTSISINHVFADINDEINDLSNRIEAIYNEYSGFLSEKKLQIWKDKLAQLGFLPHNAYLFVRGHDFYTSSIRLLDHFQRIINRRGTNTKTALDKTWQIENFYFFEKIKNDILAVFN